jgi:hypothetical protein
LSGPNIKEIHLERSIPNARKSLYVGIARFHGKSKFESCVSFNLPSKDIVRASGHNFQGSKALCTGIDKIVYCSVLPCYADNNNITPVHTYEDIEFLLNKLQNTNCIIAGDFHTKPGDFPALDSLIKDAGFTSYLNDYDTFVHPHGNKFNLDRMISNIKGLTVENIKVHQPSKPSKHMAITYDVEY